MPQTEIPTEKWTHMPSGLYVSEPMELDGNGIRLTLGYPKNLDAFNAMAEPHGIRIEDRDPPIYRVAKIAAYLSKKHGDGSRLPSLNEDFAFTLESAQATEGDIAGFYDGVAKKVWRITADILHFHEKLPNGRYNATIHRFNADGVLESAADITVAGHGFIEVLGTHGYPVKTRTQRCQVQNTLDIQGLDDYQRTGFWYVGNNPVGQERIVLRGPSWDDEWLLDAIVDRGRSYSGGYVAALRARGQTAGDVSEEIIKERERLTMISSEIKSAITELSNVASRLQDLD